MSSAPVSIPGLPPRVDPELRQFLAAIKETLEVRTRQRGNALDASPTFNDLVDSGLLKIKDGVTIGGKKYTADQLLGLVQNTIPDWITSDTAPPTPLGLVVRSRNSVVDLSWDASTSTAYGSTEIYRADANDLSQAVKVGSTSGTTYVDSLPVAGEAYYYWIRDVSLAGLASPFNDVNGTGTVAGPSAPTITASVLGPDFVLAWQTPTSNLLVQYYAIEYQALGGWVPVATVGGTSYREKARWLGGRTFRVRAIDVQGNPGVPSSVTLTLTAPGLMVVGGAFSGANAVLRWTAPTGGSLPVESYRVYDSVLSPSALLADQFATVFSTAATWSSRTFWVQAVDTAGNVGQAAEVVMTVAAPSAPALQAAFDGELVRLNWSGSVGSLPIASFNLRHGTSYATGVPVLGLQGTAHTVRADWTGARTFWIAAIDTSGTVSEATSVSVAVGAPGTPAVSHEFSGVQSVLSWLPVSSSLPLAGYEVRFGDSFATGTFVERVQATSLTMPITWTGVRTFWVAAFDSLGTFGSAGEMTVNVALPTAPTISTSFTGPDVVLKWTPSDSSLPVAEYEVLYGSTYATAASIGRVKGTTYTRRVDWVGQRQFFVVGIDQLGNVGSPGSTTLEIKTAPAPSLTAEVIDNNVLLRWTNVQGTLPTETYELRKGANFASAKVEGTKAGEFTTVFETVAGTYTYWLAAVDSAGNYGQPASVAATVSQPPDYVLAVNWRSTFDGTKSNAALQPDGSLVLPVNTTETWEQHFSSRGWSSPQDQINAGFPIYAQPGALTGFYEEDRDYGTTLAAMKVTVDYVLTAVAGTLTDAVTITTATNAAFTQNVQTFTGKQAFVVNFRFVRVRLAVTGASNAAIASVSSLTIKLDAKLKTSSGVLTCNAGDLGGSVLHLTDDRTATGTPLFVDVDAITITPGSTAPQIPVYDFEDGPNPLSLKVLLFNTSGGRISGSASYTIRGY